MASLGEFRGQTPVAAAERFRQFLSERSAAAKRLASTIEGADLDLDGSLESLHLLWQWIAPQLKPRGRLERRRHSPSWVVAGHPADALSSRGVELLDGLISYLGTVFTEQTGLAWELDTHDPSSGSYQQPVFAGGAFVPINVVNAALRRLADGGKPDEQFMQWVGATVANVNASRPAEPIVPALEIGVEVSDLPDFDWEVWIDEMAEEQLGSEQFDSLETRFADIQHVTGVVHEDRELYLVQAKDLTKEQLESAIRKIVDEARPPEG